MLHKFSSDGISVIDVQSFIQFISIWSALVYPMRVDSSFISLRYQCCLTVLLPWCIHAIACKQIIEQEVTCNRSIFISCLIKDHICKYFHHLTMCICWLKQGKTHKKSLVCSCRATI